MRRLLLRCRRMRSLRRRGARAGRWLGRWFGGSAFDRRRRRLTTGFGSRPRGLVARLRFAADLALAARRRLVARLSLIARRFALLVLRGPRRGWTGRSAFGRVLAHRRVLAR